MSDIAKLRDDIQAAEELLKNAKAEYEKSVIKALEDGMLVEREFSEWMPRCEKDGTLIIYCKTCHAKFSSHLKTNFCPNCGARMKNPKYFTRFVEDFTIEDCFNTTIVPEKKDTREQKNLLLDLKGKGMSQRDIASKLGVSQAVICNWNIGKKIIDSENLEKLHKLHESICTVN